MSKTASGLVAFAKSKIGCPYWYGTFGQSATADLLNQKIKQYPSYYTDSRISRCKTQYGKQVFDCVGLIKGYLWYNDSTKKIVYNSSQDLSAGGMLDKATQKGPISTLAELPGVLVHMTGHVGIYIGNGEVIEATVGKSEYTVKKSALAGRGWTNWSKCPYIDYESKSGVITTESYKKGDKGLGVLAYKMGLMSMKSAGLISVTLNKDNIFGDGTEKATKELQKKLGITQSGVADEATVKGLETQLSKTCKELAANKTTLSKIKALL